ncbi:hypothetical protein [Autumnicola musiva]|uniref:Uncharacterized protein n=1 Tax=Autumnicola musiva TaxID=3075589 RepID=A0ABU3D539_9FLAO|nr:hypothetical protein [Zunongwangia sp. F117]MDT0676460.1 hypothetical protein [Zunongwangia sp. F117]
MTLNSRKHYIDSDEPQGTKGHSLKKANDFVLSIRDEIAPLLEECIIYESKKRLGKAPSVELPNGKLAIAPDIRCVTKAGNVFWFEIKDKAQRFYYPDTGADIFQVYGWYKINKEFQEPVFVLFQDPDFESCLPKNPPYAKLESFKARWERSEGKPYGNWLSNLLVLKKKYPRVFSERSRNLEMYIMYFLVEKMEKVTSYQDLIYEVDNKKISNVHDELEAYLHPGNTLLKESDIRFLIKRLFNR